MSLEGVDYGVTIKLHQNFVKEFRAIGSLLTTATTFIKCFREELSNLKNHREETPSLASHHTHLKSRKKQLLEMLTDLDRLIAEEMMSLLSIQNAPTAPQDAAHGMSSENIDFPESSLGDPTASRGITSTNPK